MGARQAEGPSVAAPCRCPRAPVLGSASPPASRRLVLVPLHSPGPSHRARWWW
ncbi:hypothetical protein B484DRAFT_455617 [Ochromonadaceae sp. CCMP2298]|nr:hypothetical protein B484DRAFT_455617 [Ochromonadaceae sp. CCMP2298]